MNLLLYDDLLLIITLMRWWLKYPTKLDIEKIGKIILLDAPFSTSLRPFMAAHSFSFQFTSSIGNQTEID